LLEQVFEIAVFDIKLLALVVDGQWINGVMHDLDVGNDSGSTGLALAFRGHGQADLIAVITQGSFLLRLCSREPISSAYLFLREGYFLTRLDLFIKRRDSQNAIVHRAGL